MSIKNYIIVGNYEARKHLKNNILSCIPTLLVGPNGVGKSTVVAQIAEYNSLNLRVVYPLDQEEIAKEFGIGVTNIDGKDLYVIEADGLNSRKYSILKKYIQSASACSPFVIIAQSKDRINKKLLKHLEIIEFSYPTTEDVEKLLREHFNWDGNIEDIYDPDMRVVMARINSGEKLFKPLPEDTVSAKDLAIELGYGYVKKNDFDKLDQPLWWVIRWLAYNQRLKFPKSPVTLLKNLEKLSLIDECKFNGTDEYLHYMLMSIRGSPRRAFFKFPIWPKNIDEDKGFVELTKVKEKPIKQTSEKFTLSKWL